MSGRCAQLLAQALADVGALQERIRRIADADDAFHAALHVAQRLGVAEEVEAVGGNAVEHHLRHFGGRDLAAAHGLVGHGLADELAARRRRGRRIRPVALAAADACGHEIWAEHTGADLVRDQGQVLVQGFGEAHHGVLAHVVDAHVRGREQAGHAGRVDDVAAPGRILPCGIEHHGGEEAHAMHHAHEIHAEHPVPVGDGVFPDEAPGAHAGIVEDEMRCAETFPDVGREALHLRGFGDIHPPGQHVGTGRPGLGLGLVQRVLLHIDQHEAHAAPRADAGAFEAESRSRAGEHGGLALEVFDHGVVVSVEVSV